MPSFDSKKSLKFSIVLGTGKFGSSDNNRIELKGFRAVVDIDKAGGQMMGTLRAKIYGVKQEDMNSITTLVWKNGTAIVNTIEVFAIDGEIETLVFAGNIVNAWGDYQNMPDVYLHIQAQSAFFAGLEPVKPFSVKGGINAATVMAKIAKDMGLSFENNNVDVTLSDVYLKSTLKEQALELARMGNFTLYIDDKVLAITNKYDTRKGYIPEISAKSGLVGYPSFDGVGVFFKTLFNPSIVFGGTIKLVTDIKIAEGEWVVNCMSLYLESEKPNGQWFATVRGSKNAFAIAK